MPKVINGKTLLTYADYVRLPDDGKRHEIIRGEHFVTPSPVTRHQRISSRLFVQLHRAIDPPGLGEVFYAPTDVIISDIDVLVPDIFVVLAENREIITPKNIQGAPDLIVEITSPSTKKRDLELKRERYEKHGVPEYWIVLTEDDAVQKYRLDGERYADCGTFSDRIDFDGVEGLSVDLTKIWP